MLQMRADTMPPLTHQTAAALQPGGHTQRLDLAWRMNNGVKEFHLVAEPVVREMAPGMKAHLWGYNGQSPGARPLRWWKAIACASSSPTSSLNTPACTGMASLPNGMDGVRADAAVDPAGKTFVYEFVARRPGTFMYHPHADEMTQMAMGMMGLWDYAPEGEASADQRGGSRFLLPARSL